ncbi:MAG: GNAT family N-acetyltransferase, partial [Promethearchaeota archaeon]
MKTNRNKSNIEIKFLKNETIYDFHLCAKEFIDLIDKFEEKFLNKSLLIFPGYFKNILAGIIVAEDKRKKVDSIDNIVPSICLHLLYVNPNYRNKGIGKELLTLFINFQKMAGAASIYIKLPQKYTNGKKFLEKFEFHQIKKVKNKIILELKLWNDFGIGDCYIIEDNICDLFY